MGQYSAGEDEDRAQKDRLIEKATESLMATYVARRWPVAFVGSGLSLVYGGVTWDEAVDLILEEAVDRLNRLEAPRGNPGLACNLSAIERQRVARMLRLIRATLYRPPDEGLNANEKYVALELAQEAFAVAGVIDPHPTGTNYLSANQVFAQLALDDTLGIERLLARRFQSSWFPPSGADAIQEKRRRNASTALRSFLRGIDLQLFAAEFYRVSHVEAFIPSELKLAFSSLMSAMAAKQIDVDAPLPIDRRGMLAPFIAALSTAKRQEMFAAARAACLKRTPGDAGRHVPIRPVIDPLQKLGSRLGVSRYLTLNYDFELENLLMIEDLRGQFGRSYGMRDAENDGEVERDNRAAVGQPSLSLTRRLSDGNFVASDLYRPGSAARLFEFALNSPDHSAHIVHLHGRADNPEDMVARDADYNRFYRRTGQGRESLERALDVTLLGNPILFVGIGLNEAEITRAFRQMVSDGRITPDNPAFALMPLPKQRNGEGGLRGWREQAARYQLYGLHILHYGHPRRGRRFSLPDHLHQIETALERAKFIREKGLAVAADAKFRCKRCDRLGFIDRIVGDAQVWEWLVGLLGSSGSAITSQLALDTLESKGIRRFADGIVDFLERLSGKVYSVALEFEIEQLSEEIGRNDAYLRQDIAVRELRDSGAASWYRHLAVQPFARGKVHGRVQEVLKTVATLTSPYTVVVEGCDGAGKGQVLRGIQPKLPSAANAMRLTINLNFGIEVDSVLITLNMFLAKIHGIDAPRENRLSFLRRMVSGATSAAVPALITLIGVERLFDDDGNPISADFGLMLKVLLQRAASDIDLLILTHPRVLPALEAYRRPDTHLAAVPLHSGPELAVVTLPRASWEVGFHARLAEKITTWLASSNALNWRPERQDIGRRLEDIRSVHRSDSRRTLDASKLNSELIRLVLDHWTALGEPSAQQGVPRSQTAALELAVLDNLALAGAPIDAEVLLYAPRIKQLFERQGAAVGERSKRIEDALSALVEFGLSHRIASEPTAEDATHRFALHRAVLRFMRNRLGVPLGDGKLANNFSLTLAASLPLDTMVPDADIQAELKKLIGHFRSCWKDQVMNVAFRSALITLEREAGKTGSPLSAEGHQAWDIIRRLERIILLQAGPSSAGLRAAANLVRSFFSASSLVTTDPRRGDIDPARLPEFEAHKRRIQDIFIRIRELQFADKTFDALLRDLRARLTGTGSGAACDTLKREFASLRRKTPNLPPLFGAEIVWLHNERGVVAMLQGDLYEAEFSFNNAVDANRLYKGPEHGSGPLHNFTRIDVNRSLLLIERGRLRDAEQLLMRTAKQLDQGIASEKELIAPLLTGYRGLVAHLKGQPMVALKLYTECINTLQYSEQQRALGLFLIRRATLWRVLKQPDKTEEDVTRAVLAAEAGRQIDLLWRARLVIRPAADLQIGHERIAAKALSYAEAAGLLRVEVEALLSLIAISEDRGNHERAMQLTAKAMTVALRGGMVLRRIGLRVVMGRLMLLSGDPAGEYLLRRAIGHADLIGYGAAVERAQQALNRYLPS